MKHLLHATTALAVMGVGSTAALAGSPTPVPTEPVIVAPAPAFNWTGGYAGVQLGYLDGDMDVLFVSPPAPAPWRGQPQPSGAVAGIYGGYNWQGGSPWVFGVEGEVNRSNADDVALETIGGGVGTWSYAADINSTAALRLRAGYATGRTLFYAAAGLAYADFDLRYIDSGGGLRDTISDSRTGWTLGVGVEHALTDRWVGRIDVRYSDFGRTTYNIDEGSGIYPAGFDFTTSEIRLGLAMRF
jgi:outer membrane immunogenic protein